MVSLKIKLAFGVVGLCIILVVGLYVYSMAVPHSYTTTLTGPVAQTTGIMVQRGGNPAP